MSSVILSFFASPDAKQINPEKVQPLSLFKDSPTIVNVGMGAGSSNAERFGNKIKELRNPVTQRVLPNLLKSLGMKGVERVAVIGFSAGRAGVAGLLQNAADRDAIDTVIDLDGLHLMKNPSGTAAIPGSIDPWTAFGAQALDGSHLLVTAHTIIASPAASVFSTNESNKLLYEALTNIGDIAPKKPQAADMAKLTADTIFDPPIFIRGQAGDTDKKIVRGPLDVMNVGNSWQLSLNKLVLENGSEVPANGPAAHIFICYYVQRAIWDVFLAPRWNAPASCTAVSAPTLAHTVILWGMPGCGACETAKNFLTGKGIPFTFKDATDDDVFLEGQKAAEAQGLKADGVPITSIDGKIVLGWNKPGFEALLGTKSCGTASINQSDLDADTDLDPRNKLPHPGDKLPPPKGDGLSTAGTIVVGGIGLAVTGLLLKTLFFPKHGHPL